VLKVLHDEQHFSVRPYKDAIARITAGENMIVGMQSGDSERQTRLAIWHDAEAAYKKAREEEKPDQRVTIEAIIEATVSGIIARCAPTGRVDIARDVGCIVPLQLARCYYGIPGPDWASPTAVAVNFNKLTVADVPPSWLKRLPPVDPQDIPFISLGAWTRFAFAQVFVNIPRASELIEIAQRTTAELFGYLDELIAKAHKSHPDNKTLLGCMVAKVPKDLTFDEFNEHNKRIRLILAERIVGGTDTLNKAIVNVIDFLLKCPERLKGARDAAQHLQEAERTFKLAPQSAAAAQELANAQWKLDAIIRECLRFNPVAPMIFRACEDDTEIQGKPIKKGTLVCLLLKTAMFDPQVFPSPDDYFPDRFGNSYLTFGVSPHACGGQKVAETLLRVVVKRLSLLKDMRRAAGPAGELKNVLGLPLPDSMVVRFSP
jgi:cytochrome P450